MQTRRLNDAARTSLDVFTDRAFGGNPLAVVLDAEGLSTAQMQAIATEFNYSETTFVLPPRDAAHDAEVRIFTVRSEIPFAGHPNVGTAFVLATRAAKRRRRGCCSRRRPGLVPVEILQRGRQGHRCRADRAAAAEAIDASVSAEQAAACLSLSAADIRTDRHPPHIISVGLPFLAVELASREALRAREARMRRPSRGRLPLDGNDAIYFYTRDVPASEAPCDLQARMFHPGRAA